MFGTVVVISDVVVSGIVVSGVVVSDVVIFGSGFVPFPSRFNILCSSVVVVGVVCVVVDTCCSYELQ